MSTLYNPPSNEEHSRVTIRTSMQPKLDFLLLSLRSLLDSIGDKFSFIDVFDNFTISGNQTSVTQFFSVGGRISNIEAGEIDIDVTITRDGETTPLENGVVNLRGNVTSNSVTFGALFSYVPLTEGKYRIHVTFNGQKLTLEDDRDSFHVLRIP